MTNQELYIQAKEAASDSYSPYSDFRVGAVVLSKQGDLFYGTNVENASYGITICAERSAIVSAISSGHKTIDKIAIYAEKTVDGVIIEELTIPPCGACRQFMAEFGDDIKVIFKYKGELVEKTIDELLPYRFKL
jgi:cytidine deaminase